jgi:MFS transporter, SP family, sugar:H+ symporter
MSTSLADSKRLPADQVNQPYLGVSNARVFLLIAFVAFGGFLFGYDCIIGGQLLDMQSFARDFGTPQEPDGKPGFITAVRGLFISILSIGTFCGALTAPFICDNVGRRWGIIITCVIFSVGIAIQAGARIIHVLMVGRVIAGFGVGLVSVMVPLYQSECSPPKRRGTMVSCYQLAITIGLLIGQIVTYVTHKMESADAYRIPIALQFAWSGILGVGMFLLPETPRYLIKVGKWDDAVKAKTRLTGLAPDHPLVLDELAEIKGNYEHELNMGQSGYKDCFKGTNLRRTLLGIFMQAWQQGNFIPFGPY